MHIRRNFEQFFFRGAGKLVSYYKTLAKSRPVLAEILEYLETCSREEGTQIFKALNDKFKPAMKVAKQRRSSLKDADPEYAREQVELAAQQLRSDDEIEMIRRQINNIANALNARDKVK